MLNTTHAIQDYVSNGVLEDYNITQEYFLQSHIQVTYGPVTGEENTLALGVGFTVPSGDNAEPATGSIHLLTIPPNNDIIRIKRVVPRTQLVDLIQSGSYLADTHETAWDLLTMMIQQVADGIVSGLITHGIQSGGNLHSDVVRGGASGFMNGGVLNTIMDHVEIVAGNPHGLILADIGALGVAHLVGGAGAHPDGTALLSGFISQAQTIKLAAIPDTVDPRNVHIFEDFNGPSLDTNRWTRSTSGTAPAGSKLVTAADALGVYRETTAGGGAGSVVIRSNTPGPKTSMGITFEGRINLGVVGGITLQNFQLGLAFDPLTLAADFGYFWWDGTNLNVITRGASTPETSQITPLVVSTWYKWKIVFSSTQVDFYVDDVLKKSHLLQVPQVASAMQMFMAFDNTTAVSHSADIDYIYCAVNSRT